MKGRPRGSGGRGQDASAGPARGGRLVDLAAARRRRHLLWAGAVAALILFASGTAGPQLRPLDWIPSKDKLGHFLVFGLLATHLCCGLPPRAGRAAFVALATAGYGLLDETRQFLNPVRYFEVLDLVADALGGAVAAALHARSPRWRAWLSRRPCRGIRAARRDGPGAATRTPPGRSSG